MPPHIFRFRVLLTARATVALPPHHAATLYGLLAAALGRAGGESGIPEALLLDAPEQARTLVRDGEPYAFGVTWLAPSPEEAAGRMAELLAGLQAVGARAGPRAPKWGGNFQVTRVDDLVLGGAWTPAALPFPVPPGQLRREAAAVAGLAEATLVFESPLREERGDRHKQEGHGFFDGEFFDAPAFLSRLNARLRRTGFAGPADAVPPPGELAVAENRLVWLDISYGPADRRKSLGGAVGRVRLRGLRPEHAATLVLGQYVRAGQSTKFGFGRYRVAELGPDPAACPRAVSLLGAAGGRGWAAVVGPAATGFFEDSALAHRHGLGRDRAAGDLRQAAAAGYAWATPLDPHRLLAAVGPDLLHDRLTACLADAAAVAAVTAQAADMAPALAPLFLDHAAAAAAAAGARLARAGDDFLILARTRAAAAAWGDPKPLTAAGRVTVGPGLEGVHVQHGCLLAVYPGETEVAGLPLADLREVVIAGSPTLGPGVLEALAAHGITAIFTDAAGNEYGTFRPAMPNG